MFCKKKKKPEAYRAQISDWPTLDPKHATQVWTIYFSTPPCPATFISATLTPFWQSGLSSLDTTKGSKLDYSSYTSSEILLSVVSITYSQPCSANTQWKIPEISNLVL